MDDQCSYKFTPAAKIFHVKKNYFQIAEKKLNFASKGDKKIESTLQISCEWMIIESSFFN